jgi:hypothetical protein
MTTAVAPRTIDISPLVGGKLTSTIEVPAEMQILENGDPPPANHFMFRILHPQKGDERLTWDASDFFGIRAAKKMFVELIEKGLKPFRVGIDGKATAEIMDEFDPTAEEVIFLPQALVTGG